VSGTVHHRAVQAVAASDIVRRVLGNASVVEASHSLKVQKIAVGHRVALQVRYFAALCEAERQELAKLVSLRHEMEPIPFIPCEFTKADRKAMDREISKCRARIGRLTTMFRQLHRDLKKL
jgi:hypothetical protein